MGKNHEFVVIGGPDAVFLLILKPYTLCDLFKINSKNQQKSRVPGDWGCKRDFFAYFEAAYVR